MTTYTTASMDTGVLIRRSLFFIILVALTLANLFAFFKGLSAPHAMDQAQIAREIARGNGFTTKIVRPVAYYQAEKTAKTTVPLLGFDDTYHSPLNPLLNAAVLKLLGAEESDSWQMNENEWVYRLDRVIAAVSTLFFLMAIGVTYLLVSRIFDPKIAGVCAILMLFCEVFWEFSLSGLPQMLMLLLFSCGLYFVYRAVEASAEGRVAMTPAVIAGIFFTLLALTHWMTVWIAFGYIIFAAVAFRPRGIVAVTVLVILLVPAVFVMVRNAGITGSPFGTALLTLWNGLGASNEGTVMRNIDLEAEPLLLDGLIGKILRTTLLQAISIIPLLAGIVVAPLFFISLLHPFKRPSIAIFRWAVLLMWVTTAIGLAFFGVSTRGLDPNQLHLIFAPIMTAYGLAFISILWNRLEFVASTPALRNVHHFVVVIVCALPLVLALPPKVRLGMTFRDKGGVPNWPPYSARELNSKISGLKGFVDEREIVFSDQPWAVAWYADRTAIWLPPTREGFLKLESAAADLQTPVVGIHISPSSHGSGNLAEIAAEYRDFTALVLDGRVALATFPPGIGIFDKAPRLQDIARRYSFRQPMIGLDMVFYSERTIRQREGRQDD